MGVVWFDCFYSLLNLNRNDTNGVGVGASFWPGALPNTAQIIPPDTRSGMWCEFCVLSLVPLHTTSTYSPSQGAQWRSTRRWQSDLARSTSVLPSWYAVMSSIFIQNSLTSNFTCRRGLRILPWLRFCKSSPSWCLTSSCHCPTCPSLSVLRQTSMHLRSARTLRSCWL